MLAIHVQVHVKPESIDAFKTASVENARQSVREPGVARFDIAEEPPRSSLFRIVAPNWQRWRGDLAEDGKDVDRDRMVAALKPFFDRHGINADSEILVSAPIEHLVNSLAMACPFTPRERQALLEAVTTRDRAGILTALVEMSVASSVTPTGGAKN